MAKAFDIRHAIIDIIDPLSFMRFIQCNKSFYQEFKSLIPLKRKQLLKPALRVNPSNQLETERYQVLPNGTIEGSYELIHQYEYYEKGIYVNNMPIGIWRSYYISYDSIYSDFINGNFIVNERDLIEEYSIS